ncbi:MAG: DUF1634 domain-containing protein [Ktedonobacteraceae bacterium]|nr:DUF1634 domain-containing protein [Ktedonobacteraceae bacterium]
MQMQDSTTHPQSNATARHANKIDISAIIGGVLQGGVLLSAAIIVAGVLLALLKGTLASSQLHSFPQSFGQIWTGLLILQPQAIIMLGVLLLIATPVLRVAISILAFALEQDMKFVLITSAVLIILLVGFLLGKGGA